MEPVAAADAPSQIEVAHELYGCAPASCPFTLPELAEMERRGEMAVYVPAGISAAEMCRLWGITSNVDFEADRLIRYAMVDEDHWFVTAASTHPELLNLSAVAAKRQYEDDGLHGLDVRRYLAFVATYRAASDVVPDRAYWTFLHSGSYDRSGISIIGFDVHGVLSHHGWMKNFRAKFVGSRYAALAPRVEITRETAALPRAYRRGGSDGHEAGME